MVHTATWTVHTRGNGDMFDVTEALQEAVTESSLRSGIAVAFVVGSTAAMTTIEYEPGLVKDLAVCMERLAPEDAPYAHEARWGDDNGHSHLRSSMLGTSVTVPFVGGQLCLGAWQQVVIVDFDTRVRKRDLIFQILGE